MTYAHDLSRKETAKHLGVSLSQVERHLARARTALRDRTRERPLRQNDRCLPPATFNGTLYEITTEIALPDTKIVAAVAPQIQIATAAIAERLKAHPEGVHDLTPRQFEELIGELLTDMRHGRIEITPFTRDGGKDLLAYVDLEMGRLLWLFETKKYRLDRPVGVELVRALYGVVESEEATHGTLITTSSFSTDAVRFQAKHEHRLSLRDYSHVVEWIRRYGTRRH